MKNIAIVCFCLLLQGCAGLAVGTYGTFENERTSANLTNERNKLDFAGNDVLLTKDELISLWGEPDVLESTGSCDVAIYHDGYTWSGVGALVLVLPIPLLVPTGHQEQRFYFIDGEFERLVTEYGAIKGVLGYVCDSNECKGVAGRVNTNRTREVEVTWCE